MLFAPNPGRAAPGPAFFVADSDFLAINPISQEN